MSARKVRVLISCTGIGIYNRGIETFFQDAFDALVAQPGLDVHLAKGRGFSTPREHPIQCFPRTGTWARLIGLLVRRSSYVVEQWSSFFGIVLLVRRLRPEVIYYSDANLGFLLFWFRRIIRVKYVLLYSNGGPVKPPYRRVDYIHQVAPHNLDEALCAGELSDRQILVPYGFQLAAAPQFGGIMARQRKKVDLGLPHDRPIILSVGWVSRRLKRMDYVIREVASLPTPRPHLVILGALDHESAEIIALAQSLLGNGEFTIRSEPPNRVWDYYFAADVFVLASVHEGFGRVYVEALAAGLPVIAHDGPAARFTLGKHGRLIDMTQEGALMRSLSDPSLYISDPDRAFCGWKFVRDKFSWDSLASDYEMMFNYVCRGRIRRA